MKTQKLQYNLAGIMRYAHHMFSVVPMSMSERLKAAWALAKSYMASGKANGQFVVAITCAGPASYEEAVENWYATAPRGTYFGD